MSELILFSDLYKFLGSLGPMRISMTGKTLSIGFTPMKFAGKMAKFATLNGEKNYRCLILHVDAGNPNSIKGPKIQEQVQALLGFDIEVLRKFKKKGHEVYIPLEVLLDSSNLKAAKEFTQGEYLRITHTR
ncbi:hypothetical protein ACF3OH_00205 [Chryseomicrobium aureum]|uniref:hypothetical protein n=1 Tax=Chryseomicrobium aureum TaxID=1441723 RepID=UPI00370D03C4